MRARRPRGLTSAELITVIAVLGLLAASAAPLVLGWRTSSLTAGAEELKALLNAARHLAVAENTSVCVAPAGSAVRFVIGSCTGRPWTGAGSDGEGFIPLASGVTISTASPAVFTYLGAAAPAGSYTVAAPAGEARVRVVVAASGRIAVVP